MARNFTLPDLGVSPVLGLRYMDHCVHCGDTIARQIHDRHPDRPPVAGRWRNATSGYDCPAGGSHAGEHDPLPDFHDRDALERWLAE